MERKKETVLTSQPKKKKKKRIKTEDVIIESDADDNIEVISDIDKIFACWNVGVKA